VQAPGEYYLAHQTMRWESRAHDTLPVTPAKAVGNFESHLADATRSGDRILKQIPGLFVNPRWDETDL